MVARWLAALFDEAADGGIDLLSLSHEGRERIHCIADDHPYGWELLSGVFAFIDGLHDVFARRAVDRQRLEDMAVTLRPRADALQGTRVQAAQQGTHRAGEVTETRRLATHAAPVETVAFSPDGTVFASGSDGGDGAVRLWDTRTGTLLHSLEGHASGVWSLAFSADGDTLASRSTDGAVRLWDPRTGASVRALAGHAAWVYSVALSPDGAVFASASGDGTMRLWDVRAGAQPRFLMPADGVRELVFSDEGIAPSTVCISCWSWPLMLSR